MASLHRPAVGSLLRQRAFVAVWAGQSVSQLGSAMTTLALPLLAIEQLAARPGDLGLLRAAFALSAIVAALPSGVLVDRASNRRVMIGCDVVQAVALAAIPVAAATGSLSMGVLYLVALVNGAVTLLFGVSYHAYVPKAVRADQLPEANAKMASTEAFARVSGPSVGGAAVAAFGAVPTMVVDALTYVFSAAVTLWGAPRDPAPDRDADTRRAVRRSLVEAREGVRIVGANAVLASTALTSIGSVFALSMVNAVFVYFLVHDLALGAGTVGVIFAVGEVGGFVAAVFAARVMRRVGSARVMWLAVLAAPVAFVPAFATRGNAEVLVGAFLVLSSCRFVLFDIAQYSYRQYACPTDAYGRMTASIRLGIGVATALGALAGGWLGNTLGARATLAVAAAVVVASSVPVLCSRLRRVRDMTDLPGAADTAAHVRGAEVPAEDRGDLDPTATPADADPATVPARR